MSQYFRYISHQKIDFKKWDRCVQRSPEASVFAVSYYLNAVSPGWDALVKGDYETVFPITKKRKLGYTYLPHPPFTGRLGLIGQIDEAAEREVLKYLEKNYKLVEIELNDMHQIKHAGISKKCTYIIDYSKTYAFNENTKRNIQRANKADLQVETTEDKSLLILSKKYLDPFITESLKINAYGLNRFHDLLKAALHQKQIKTYCTKNKNGDVLALAHFIYNKHQVIYLKGSNFDKEANSGSMHLLMSRAIEDFKGKVKIFDFSGGSLPNIGRFFKGLGGEPLYYPVFKYNGLPGFIQLLKGKS